MKSKRVQNAGLPCRRSSVLILLVWFHVLSINTTLCRGHCLDSVPFVSAVPGWEDSAVHVESPSSSHFSRFFLGSSEVRCNLLLLWSCKCCIMSCTDTACGPGNTITTCQEKKDVHSECNTMALSGHGKKNNEMFKN